MVIVIISVMVDELNGLTMISCFKCPITGVRLQPTVRLHCRITNVQNEIVSFDRPGECSPEKDYCR